jgi:hypothetical protein
MSQSPVTLEALWSYTTFYPLYNDTWVKADRMTPLELTYINEGNLISQNALNWHRIWK